MQFGHPFFLYFTLGLIPLLAVFWLWANWQRRRNLDAFGEEPLVTRLASHLSPTRRTIRNLALSMGLIFFSLALSEPYYGAKMVEVKRQGRDIYIALDVSRSMLAEDIKPNRLLRAQQELSALVDKLGGDRVGVIAFAGMAQVACPLTTDYDAAKMFLNYITPDSVMIPGTSLGAAIRTATEAFPKGGEGFRVLVLLTDGEDHHSQPLEAAEAAKAAGIRILSIGFGTSTGEPIPVRDASGQTKNYLKDRAGQTVVSKLDEATLKQLASITNGVYLPAQQGVLEAERMTELINQMQKRTISGGQFGALEDRYQYFLLPALLLLLFAFWLPERKKSWLLFFGLMVLFFSPRMGFAGTADDINRGNHQYYKKKYESAVKAYRDAQIKNPENPVIYYDLGNALHQMGQFPEAEQAYEKTLKAKDKRLQAETHYNLGNNYCQQQKYAEAIKQYYQALRLKPRDEDTIYNLSQAMAYLKTPPKNKSPQKKQDQSSQQKNQSGGQSQDQKQSQNQKSSQDKNKSNPGEKGPDDKGEKKSGQDIKQDTPQQAQRAPKPGEMSKTEAENVLEAVREAEQNAQRERLKQSQQHMQNQGQEDW